MATSTATEAEEAPAEAEAAEVAPPQDPFEPAFFLRNGGLPVGMETKDELPETHGLSGEDYVAAEALLRYIGSCGPGGAPHPGRMYLTPLLVTMFVRHYSDSDERCEKLAASLAWRVLPHLEFSTLLTRRIAMARKADSLWPSCVYGSDQYGRVVQAHRLKLIVIDELLAYEDMRPLVVVRAQLMEAMMRMKLECSAQAGFRVYKNILVVDLDGFAFGTALKLRSEMAREKLQALFALGDHYPGSVDKIFLTNTPGIFRGAWKLIKKTLDPVTAGKIHMHATHAACRADMLACQIPMQSIPEWMGGRHGGTSLLALVESRIAESDAAAAAEEGGAGMAAAGGAEEIRRAAHLESSWEEGSAAELAPSPPRAWSSTSLAVAEDYLVGEMTPCVDVEVAVLGRARPSAARLRSSSAVAIENGEALRLFLECTVSSRTFNAAHFGGGARINAWRSMALSAARGIAAREQRIGAHGTLEGFSKRTIVYMSSGSEVELFERSHVELDGPGLRPVRCVLESKRQVAGDGFFVLSRLVLTERRRRSEGVPRLGADADASNESEGVTRHDADGGAEIDRSAPPDLPLLRVQVGVHVVFNRSLARTPQGDMSQAEVTAHAVSVARAEWTQWLDAATRACSIPAAERAGTAATLGAALKESASASAAATAPTSPGVASPLSALPRITPDAKVGEMAGVLDVVLPFSIADVRALLLWGRGGDILAQYMVESAECRDVDVAPWAPLAMGDADADAGTCGALGDAWKTDESYVNGSPAGERLNLFRRVTLIKPVQVPLAGTYDAHVRTDESCALIGGPNGQLVFRGQLATTGVPMSDQFTMDSRTVFARHPVDARAPTEQVRMRCVLRPLLSPRCACYAHHRHPEEVLWVSLSQFPSIRASLRKWF